MAAALPQWSDREDAAADDVCRWRYHKFRELGFERPDSHLLAESDADWHEMEALLLAGCPREIAERLLT